MSRYLYIFFTVWLCLLLIFYHQSGIFDKSLFIVLTSIFIITFSVVQVFSFSGEPYSLHKIYYLFALFFFGIAPVIQYFDQISLWIRTPLTDNQYILTNTIVVIILVNYNLVYRLVRGSLGQRRSQILSFNIYKSNQKISTSNGFLRRILFLGISVISFFIVFSSNNYSWFLLFVRGGELFNEIMAESSNSSSSVQWLIINNFVRPMAMVSFMLYYIECKKLNFFGLVLLVIAVLTCMPSAMPRFAVAALYLPLLLLFFQVFLRKFNFVVAFLLGFMLVFPFLDSFRNFTVDKEGFVLLNFDMFRQGHFDSYQNFAVIISNNIVTYGYQLLGALFFWVPRVFWPSKPVGSGTFLARELQLDFENISANYFAEGFINFGYLGIVLFLIVLAAVTAVVDSRYWCGCWTLSPSKKLLYLMSLGFMFFLLRGDLLNSTAYFVGFYSSIVVVNSVTGFKYLHKYNEH